MAGEGNVCAQFFQARGRPWSGDEVRMGSGNDDLLEFASISPVVLAGIARVRSGPEPWNPRPATQALIGLLNFFACDSICLLLARYMLSAVRPSVFPSVAWVDESKTVEVRIMKFSLFDSPSPLVFAG